MAAPVGIEVGQSIGRAAESSGKEPVNTPGFFISVLKNDTTCKNDTTRKQVSRR
ncbi:hypothetical protein [Ponticoccus alexandrii]|uniref:Uncharacterized protein n=1 Tax=Ponticoccus alexandrii TaxID=1943633 RepID=A0ABX7F6H1_9RHOB|nr:hypothetical protein [Ponticoccus alexandrii]QRF65714.1 hypothetical protein GQA70_04900 [Ponticoccus alexandrii]